MWWKRHRLIACMKQLYLTKLLNKWLIIVHTYRISVSRFEKLYKSSLITDITLSIQIRLNSKSYLVKQTTFWFLERQSSIVILLEEDTLIYYILRYFRYFHNHINRASSRRDIGLTLWWSQNVRAELRHTDKEVYEVIRGLVPSELWYNYSVINHLTWKRFARYGYSWWEKRVHSHCLFVEELSQGIKAGGAELSKRWVLTLIF